MVSPPPSLCQTFIPPLPLTGVGPLQVSPGWLWGWREVQGHWHMGRLTPKVCPHPPLCTLFPTPQRVPSTLRAAPSARGLHKLSPLPCTIYPPSKCLQTFPFDLLQILFSLTPPSSHPKGTFYPVPSALHPDHLPWTVHSPTSSVSPPGMVNLNLRYRYPQVWSTEASSEPQPPLSAPKLQSFMIVSW